MELSHNLGAIDLGAWTIKIAALSNQHRFQILVNEANFRQTPSVVSFTNAQRLIGDQAVIKMKSNFKNTIRSPQRLIGLGRKPHLVEQQIRYSTITHNISNNAMWLEIEQDNKNVKLLPEQVLIALLTKVKSILQNNSVKSDLLFLSIQSYLNNGERKAIKSCAQATGFKNVSLIQQWEAICAQYFYVRQKDIESTPQQIAVIFVDLGYTNFAVHACLISKNKMSLLDQQYLRYTGAKNIDNLLAQFYIQMVKKQSGKDIRLFPKSLVKLMQAIQIQRKKLSANIENQLTIQCLVGDYDLSYNMKRQQLQNIAMPILADLASAMQNLRSRVQPQAPIHSIQLIGGLSRMPFVQQIIKSVFNQEPSKKMNASQSVARGCSIAGASRMGLLKSNTCNFVRTVRFTIFIFIHYVSKDNKIYGKNHLPYGQCQRKILFDRNSILPANSIPKIDGEGPIQVLICQEGLLQLTTIGYISFKGPDSLTVLIDGDGIMRARLMKQNNFQNYDLGDLISVQNTVKLREQQQKMKKRDNNILQCYQIKNQFQSLLYNTKESLKSKWTQFCPPAEASTILQIIAEGQQYLSHNQQHTTDNFKQRIQTVNMLTEIIEKRRSNYQKIQAQIQTFNSHFATVSKLHPQPQYQVKMSNIKQTLVDLYNKQATSYWEGHSLSENKVKQIIGQIDKLK